ncbi:MAG: DUF3237 family protein [Desulfobacteraceae bacterium]
MESTSINVGELIYEAAVHFTKVTEYGISMNDLLSGTAVPPPSGVRFDFAFEGSFEGPRLSGTIAGIDYLHVRADGRFQLHIHAQLITNDGENISFFADGIAIPQEGNTMALLRENISFITSSPDYAWLNQVQAWGQGTVDLGKSEVSVKAYAA